MINLFKPPVFTTAPINPSDSNTVKKGPRWTRKKYIFAHLASMLPLVLFILYEAYEPSTRFDIFGLKTILILLVTAILMLVVSFFATLGRLRDIDVSPQFVCLFVVPVLNVFLFVFLAFRPGTKGPNKYGNDPRSSTPRRDYKTDDNQYDESTESVYDTPETEHEGSKLDSLRNWATHKNIKATDEPIDIHESAKQLLSKTELIKVIKNRTTVTKSKVVVVGFDKTNSKYYMSVAALGTPVEQFEKEYFINYELMRSSLLSKTGLLIDDLAQNQ